MKFYNLAYTYSIFIYLIPLLLLTGSFLPDLVISIMGLSFIFVIFKNKLFKYCYNIYSFFFFILYIFLCISSLSSDNIISSLESSITYVRFFLFSLVLWFVLDNNSKFIKSFTYFFLVTFILVLFDGYIQYLFNRNLFGFTPSWEESVRLTLVFNDDLILGGYLSRFLPLLIGLIILSFKNDKLVISVSCILLILTDILVYVSGERTAMGLLLISTILIIFLLSKFSLIRLITFFVSIFIIILITLFQPNIKQRNIDQTLNQIGISNGKSADKEIYIFSKGHQSYFSTSIDLFLKNPLIGIGPNNFRESCKEYIIEKKDLACSTHPHNIYIQLLAETGIIGFLIIFIIFCFVLMLLIKHFFYKTMRNNIIFNDYQLCLLITIFLSLFPFLPTQNFFNGWINIIYYFPVGFFIHSIYSKSFFADIKP